MTRLIAYTLYCAVVAGLFGYGHLSGRSLFDDLPDQASSSSSSSGSGSTGGYTGISGGSHK